PLSTGSSPFTHRISVLFPDPDGPHTTTTDPLATHVVQPSSARNWPYHSETSWSSIMAAREGESPGVRTRNSFGFAPSCVKTTLGCILTLVIPSAARNPHHPDRGPSIGTTKIPRLSARDDNRGCRSG